MQSKPGWLLASAVLAIASGCGGNSQQLERAFSTNWTDDGGSSISAVQQRLSQSALPAEAPVAVGVTSSGLVGIGLEGTERWTARVKVDSRPAVAGELVLASADGEVFALDALSGERLWSVSSPGHVVRGAGSDGELTAVNLAERKGGGSLLLVVDRNGGVVSRLQTKVKIGSPAVKGGVAFVPWHSQYVSAIDLRTGNELGRLLLRERVSHAVRLGGELYFGEAGLFRFDEQIGKATRGRANRVCLPKRALPGEPVWFGDGTTVVPADSSARDRIRLYAHPAKVGGELSIDSSRYAATYFRVVMGLDVNDGVLGWVRTLPESVLGGAATTGGFVLCDRSGKVWLLDARTGGDAGHLSLGEALESCVVRAGNLRVPSTRAKHNLAAQLGAAIALDDTKLAAAQRFLLRELGKLKQPAATKTLVQLASNPRTPPALLDDTRRLLAARRTGAKHMLEALRRHYDFLSDVLRPPPVGPLADALAAMGERRAAPLLARHLNDPADSPDDVKRAARALVELATAKEYDKLKTFFSLYRATADNAELVAAAISVAEAIVKVGGDKGRAVVQRAAADPLTIPQIRKGISELVATGEAGSAPAGEG